MNAAGYNNATASRPRFQTIRMHRKQYFYHSEQSVSMPQTQTAAIALSGAEKNRNTFTKTVEQLTKTSVQRYCAWRTKRCLTLSRMAPFLSVLSNIIFSHQAPPSNNHILDSFNLQELRPFPSICSFLPCPHDAVNIIHQHLRLCWLVS